MDSEVASVIRFVQDRMPAHTIYLGETPEDFAVPSVYFPQPEVTTKGSSASTYSMSIALSVKFFAFSEAEAMENAVTVVLELNRARGAIPEILESGDLSGKILRVYDPEIRPIADSPAAVQLTLRWKSYRPYAVGDAEKVRNVFADLRSKGADT